MRLVLITRNFRETCVTRIETCGQHIVETGGRCLYDGYAGRCAFALWFRNSLSSIVVTFAGRLASTRESLREGRVGPADVLGPNRDRVAIRIALACGARRRKELPSGRRRFSGSKGKLITRSCEIIVNTSKSCLFHRVRKTRRVIDTIHYVIMHYYIVGSLTKMQQKRQTCKINTF